MTLLSWNLAPARVQIVMDTLAFDRDGAAMYFQTKFFHLAHARLVICSAGAAAVGYELERRACTCRLLRGFDDFAARVADWTAEIHQGHLGEYGGLIESGSLDGEAIVVAFGWSEEQGRIVGYGVGSARGYNLEPIGDQDWHFPPPATDPDDPYVKQIKREHSRELERAKFPEAFIPIAKLQRHFAMKAAGFGIGGELLLCEMTRDRLAVRRLWEFPDHAETMAALHREAAAAAPYVPA